MTEEQFEKAERLKEEIRVLEESLEPFKRIESSKEAWAIEDVSVQIRRKADAGVSWETRKETLIQGESELFSKFMSDYVDSVTLNIKKLHKKFSEL